MEVVVRQLIQERARLQDESGQHHLGQVHAGPQLLQQRPDKTLVLLRHRLHLGGLASLGGGGGGGGGMVDTGDQLG